jgi:uroporphyrinogen-III synthase
MEALLVPAIEIAEPESWCGLDAALSAIRSYDWVVFASANAVEAFAARAGQLGVRAQARRIAVVGPATAKAVEAVLGQGVDLMPDRYVAEGLAAALAPVVQGTSVLIVRAAVARDVLPEALAAAGAVVTVAEAYQNVVPAGSVAALQELFAEGVPEGVAFTSGSTVRNLHALLEAARLELPEGVVLGSIGPVTSGVMRELGWEPTVEAEEATVAGLAGAFVEAIENT